MSHLPLLPTTVVGSYPQPDTLIDRARLAKAVPRVREQTLWRHSGDALGEAQDAAARQAIADMENAGIDIVTDGEVRRESYSNYFVGCLDGIDLDDPGTIVDHRGTVTLVPRVVGGIARRTSASLDDLTFLAAHTTRVTKITVPGPFTMSQQCVDEHYGDREALAMAFAAAVNEELLELQAAGAGVVQIDEPWLRNDPDAARAFAVGVIDRALAGVSIPTVLHLCFGYAAMVAGGKPTAYSFLPELTATSVAQISIEAAQPNLDLGVLDELTDKTIVLGVLDLADPDVETPEVVAARLRRALEHVPAGRLVAAPDCGMKFLPRARAREKLVSLAAGAAIVRAEQS
ncbi:MAG: hypothetical protein U0R50_16315 [Gaiellales bacterium]